MYTFIISVVFFLLLSGIIFRKNIKNKSFTVAIIVIIGTLLTNTIVNGIVGFNTPFENVKIKEVKLELTKSEIFIIDTTEIYNGYLCYDLSIKKRNEGVKITCNNFGVQNTLIDELSSSKLKIHYLPEGDTIPYREVYQKRRLVDKNWVVPFGVPRGKRIQHFYIPNDSIHNTLIDTYINKYYYEED